MNMFQLRRVSIMSSFFDCKTRLTIFSLVTIWPERGQENEDVPYQLRMTGI